MGLGPCLPAPPTVKWEICTEYTATTFSSFLLYFCLVLYLYLFHICICICISFVFVFLFLLLLLKWEICTEYTATTFSSFLLYFVSFFSRPTLPTCFMLVWVYYICVKHFARIVLCVEIFCVFFSASTTSRASHTEASVFG